MDHGRSSNGGDRPRGDSPSPEEKLRHFRSHANIMDEARVGSARIDAEKQYSNDPFAGFHSAIQSFVREGQLPPPQQEVDNLDSLAAITLATARATARARRIYELTRPIEPTQEHDLRPSDYLVTEEEHLKKLVDDVVKRKQRNVKDNLDVNAFLQSIEVDTSHYTDVVIADADRDTWFKHLKSKKLDKDTDRAVYRALHRREEKNLKKERKKVRRKYK